MTLLIDLSLGLGTHGAVFDDLVQIVGCDPGLGTSQPTQFVLQVTFDQKQLGGVSSNRIRAFVNAPQNILIVGVDSTFIVPGGTLPITAYTGGVVTPGSLTTPVTIWLDVTDAGGAFYHVHDRDSLTIYEPRPVILYHELAHVWHLFVANDAPASDPAQEVQAIADENNYRSILGLPLRHPSDHFGSVGEPFHGGVGFPRCKPLYPGFNWDCIVATAAVGSPHAPLVATLRKAKREYRSLSGWAALAADPILALYGRFSPHVVNDMESDPGLRDAMLRYAVQPVAHLLEMVETYLTADADGADVFADMDRSVDAYIAELAEASGSQLVLGSMAESVSDASRRLSSDCAEPARPPSRAIRNMPEDLFDYLASAIESSGRDTTGFAWAFAGLALFLRQAAARLGDNATLGPDAVADLSLWLVRLPIPYDAELSLSEAPEELRILGERLFTRPTTRELFARYLLARWPVNSAPALESLLRDLRYVAMNSELSG